MTIDSLSNRLSRLSDTASPTANITWRTVSQREQAAIIADGEA
jgi:hypothetical protein